MAPPKHIKKTSVYANDDGTFSVMIHSTLDDAFSCNVHCHSFQELVTVLYQQLQRPIPRASDPTHTHTSTPRRQPICTNPQPWTSITIHEANPNTWTEVGQHKPEPLYAHFRTPPTTSPPSTTIPTVKDDMIVIE